MWSGDEHIKPTAVAAEAYLGDGGHSVGDAFRPALLTPTLAAQMASTYQRLSGGRLLVNMVTGAEPAELAGQLWDLPSWARTGERLLADMADAADVPARFVTAAAMVRHLLTDPVLPAREPTLLPAFVSV